MKRSEICVYILTHNRPETILRSLNSVRNQRFNDFTIIVSDNSTNDDTEVLVIPITLEDKRVKYIKRGIECNTVEKHMNYILRYNSYRYFMMFHDDDEMLPDMIELLYTFISKHKECIAVGTNALYNKYGKETNIQVLKINKDIILKEPKEMALRYANMEHGIVPFPSYMYNSNLIRGMKMDYKIGGKYFDASFIISLLDKGNIGVLSKPLMIYYVSKNQDSQSHDFKQYLSLIKFLKNILGKDNLRERRLYNMYSEIRRIQLVEKKAIFKKKLLLAFFIYSPKNYFPKYIFRLLNIKKS